MSALLSSLLLLGVSLEYSAPASLGETAFLTAQNSNSKNVVTYTPPSKSSGLNGKDVYENNNNMNDATILIPQTYFETPEIVTSLSGNLDTEMGWDIDYFSFALISDSKINIRFNTIQTGDAEYVFQIFKWKIDSNNTGKVADRYYETLYEIKTSQDTIEFNESLEAGSYYIFTQGRQENIGDESINYSLTLSSEKDTSEYLTYFDLEDEFSNHGFNSFVWVSDLAPLDFFGTMNMGNVYEAYNPQKYAIMYHPYEIEWLKSQVGKNPFLVANICFYKDSMLRSLTKGIIRTLRLSWEEKFEAKQIEKITFEKNINTTQKAVDITIKVISTAGKLITSSFGVDISKEIELGEKVVSAAADLIFKLVELVFTPEGVTKNEIKILDWVSMVETALDSKDSVITIPIYAQFSESRSDGSFSFDFSPTPIKHDKTSFYLYPDKDIDYPYEINAHPDDAYCKGKVYALYESISDGEVKKVNLADALYQVSGIDSSSHSNQMEGLGEGEVAWYSFKAPMRNDETKENITYNFYTVEEGLLFNITTQVELFVAPYDISDSSLNYNIPGKNHSFGEGLASGYVVSKKMKENELVYIAVHGKDGGETNAFTLYVMEEDHVCAFNGNYMKNGLFGHYRTCICGYKKNEAHAYIKTSSNKCCRICGYVYPINSGIGHLGGSI